MLNRANILATLTTAVHVTIGLHHPNNNTKGQTEEF